VSAAVRHADPSRDAAACAGAYAPSVLESIASFEEVAPGPAEMAARIERVSATHPWLVAERDGVVAGYAYASPYRDRAAYRWAAEVAIHIGPAHRGRGVGRELYGALLPLLERQRLRVLLAGITLPNAASVGLHEAVGFRLVGVYERIGYKHGAWRDVGWWQLELPEPAPGAPAEPLGPQRLD
jgi:phosphinothricin acetyltransferase